MHYFSCSGRVRSSFYKKGVRTRYTELVFLHPVGSVGQLAHSSASRARNIDTLFSCSGGPMVVSVISVLGHIMSNFYFLIWWDMWVT
jgi:hypothetical protein